MFVGDATIAATHRYWSLGMMALIDEISKPKSIPPIVATIARK
jgi:hypothetical protein